MVSKGEEGSQSRSAAPECVIVVFGQGGGDLVQGRRDQLGWGLPAESELPVGQATGVGVAAGDELPWVVVVVAEPEPDPLAGRDERREAFAPAGAGVGVPAVHPGDRFQDGVDAVLGTG